MTIERDKKIENLEIAHANVCREQVSDGSEGSLTKGNVSGRDCF